MEGDQFAIACDTWTDVRSNTREIGLYVREKRKMENRPVTTGQSEFATARLPPADEDAIAAPAASSEDVLNKEPHEILEVTPDAPGEVVRAAFKAQVRNLNGHPNTDGSSAGFQRLKRAREAILDN